MKFRHYPTGSALVIVLCSVALASVMVVAVMVAARLERQSAYYHVERIRAEAMAQSGLAHSLALLRSATGETDKTWISGPGRIIPVTFGSTSPYGDAVDLFSGTANTDLSNAYQPPNLNAAQLDGTYPLDPSGAEMRVKWIYVRKDGTIDLSDTPDNDLGNPLIGRYAFWVDDASCRINLNTAWSRSTKNTKAPADLSRINLAATKDFSEDDADETHANATESLFNSSFDLRSANLISAVTTNRWSYTFFNHATDLNPFGEPKIYLTTQLSNLPAGFSNVPNYTHYFFDILTSANTDPGISDNLDDAKVAQVVNRLYSYLIRKDWPVYAGMSFSEKYWGNDADPRIFQMAVNIVEYVRAKESKQKIVNAIRGYISGNQFISITKSHQENNVIFPINQTMPLIGITRSPVITETALYYCASLRWKNPGVAFQAEIYLPPNIGIDQLDGNDFKLSRQFISDVPVGDTGTYGDRWGGLSYVAPSPNLPFYDPPDSGFWAVPSAGQATFPITKGQYIKVESWHTNGASKLYLKNFPTASYRFWLGITTPNHGYALSTSSSLDYWRGNLTTSRGIGPVVLTADLVNTESANTWQVDDPVMGCLNTNSVQAASTWGLANRGISTLGAPPAVTTPPQQDTDLDGKVTDIGWRLPYPAGDPKNQTGRVDSLAELGYVNTGVVCWTSADHKNGVPYRTLRLQPSSSVTLPDWALLDLFAIPPQSADFIRQPHSWKNTAYAYGAQGGRLNINGLLQPFTSLRRTSPLVALFSEAENPISNIHVTETEASTMAANILQSQFATQGRAYDSTNGLVAHIGQLAEFADWADKGEASEGNLFEPLAQTTVNGNVFVVYTIGQALQQLPGSFKINGEKRYEAVVERVSNVPAASGSSGLLRTIVTHEITP